MVGTRHIDGFQILEMKGWTGPEMIDMSRKKRQIFECPGKKERQIFGHIIEFSGKRLRKDRIIMRPRRYIEISDDRYILMPLIGFMFLEIIDERDELVVPHDEMIVIIRRAGMEKIEIDLMSGIRKGEITIPPHSLREIISPIGKGIFAEYHAADEFLGPGCAICIRIGGLEKILEIIIMMISEFNEHEHIRIDTGDEILDIIIGSIILMDIREKYGDVSGTGLQRLIMSRGWMDIEMIDSSAKSEKQEAEHKEGKRSERTKPRRTISGFHALPQKDQHDGHSDTADCCKIGQETEEKFSDVGSREE